VRLKRSPYREYRFAVQIGIGTAAISFLVPGNADVIVLSAGSNDSACPNALAPWHRARGLLLLLSNS
jgi:hypothetical protein